MTTTFAIEMDDRNDNKYAKIHAHSCSDLIDPERVYAEPNLASLLDAVNDLTGWEYDISYLKISLAPCAKKLLVD